MEPDRGRVCGFELHYDDALRGEPGWETRLRDSRSRTHPDPERKCKSAQAGANIVLTLDADVQVILEEELWSAIREHRAGGGVALAMEPRTGRIVGMTSLPSWDSGLSAILASEEQGTGTQSWDQPGPKDGKASTVPLVETPPSCLLRNRAISDLYEPGSVFKLVALAAALEDGVINPEDRLCGENGSIRIQDHTIGEAEGHRFGWLSLREAIVKSSNICMIKVAAQVGKRRFYEMARNFGFGLYTGIDLPAEERGVLLDPRIWSPLHFANLAFGQGVLVSPLQITCAYAAVANHGFLMRPQVVEQIVAENGEMLREFTPDTVRSVVSTCTAQIMTEIFQGVVEEGTAKAARIEGVPIAGKTGTAQKVSEGSRGYAAGKTVATFVGFLPATDPALVLTVVIDDPAGGLTGGAVCAPVFRRIVEKIRAIPHGSLEGIGNPLSVRRSGEKA